jgi:hypothetical protein
MAINAFARLRRLSMIAIVSGAAGSVGLMFYFGRGQRSLLLIILFTVWVTSPFLALAWAHAAAKRSTERKQTAVGLLALMIAVGSLTVYGIVALGPPRPQPAKFFLLTPAASWLLIVVAGICLFKTIAVVASVLGVAIGSFVAFLWLERTSDTELPAPTGLLPDSSVQTFTGLQIRLDQESCRRLQKGVCSSSMCLQCRSWRQQPVLGIGCTESHIQQRPTGLIIEHAGGRFVVVIAGERTMNARVKADAALGLPAPGAGAGGSTSTRPLKAHRPRLNTGASASGPSY